MGKRKMFRADFSTKSSVSPRGIIVRNESKSLKVFIAFALDIYPIHRDKEDIDFIVILHDDKY